MSFCCFNTSLTRWQFDNWWRNNKWYAPFWRTWLLQYYFGEAGFELHKWYSKEQTLESEASSQQEDEKRSYAKEQLGIKPGETKMLGLPWDKLKHMMAVTFPVYETLNKHSFWKTMRVTAWIMRFVWNCKENKSEGLAGPLTTPETDKAVHWWVKRAQESNMENSKGVNECCGRIQFIRKLFSLPGTKCIAIREVNTRCPCIHITRGSGPYHDLHQMRLLDASPETFNKEG